ncbi:hypothetical protein K432DRAFT_382465 [Lepidopterella palustris CBS 459.81]|uniref:Uncharacterized protein n=1 Tax=Lepidopterella palustris CBS 459.81 TaxID=1314670 RepID=A0A8E2EAI0_9PEZI|nr:hypothetical protein K432DRAFT_382465 [Lepidopterella palustris CBS 459.81]
MRFAILSLLLALLAAYAIAVAPQKSVIVSYPDNTPDSVLSQAKAAIVDAGGIITHEYKIIKAFACNAPAAVLENVQAWGSAYNAVVEDDSVVSINNDE